MGTAWNLLPSSSGAADWKAECQAGLRRLLHNATVLPVHFTEPIRVLMISVSANTFYLSHLSHQ